MSPEIGGLCFFKIAHQLLLFFDEFFNLYFHIIAIVEFQ